MRSLLHYPHLRNMIVQGPLLWCYDMSEETDCRRLCNGTSDTSVLAYMPEWIAAYFVSQGAGMEKTPNELTLKVTITKYRPTRAFSGSHIITNKPKQFV